MDLSTYHGLLAFAQPGEERGGLELTALQHDADFFEFLDNLMGPDNEEDMALSSLTNFADLQSDFNYQRTSDQSAESATHAHAPYAHCRPPALRADSLPSPQPNSFVPMCYSNDSPTSTGLAMHDSLSPTSTSNNMALGLQTVLSDRHTFEYEAQPAGMYKYPTSAESAGASWPEPMAVSYDPPVITTPYIDPPVITTPYIPAQRFTAGPQFQSVPRQQPQQQLKPQPQQHQPQPRQPQPMQPHNPYYHQSMHMQAGQVAQAASQPEPKPKPKRIEKAVRNKRKALELEAQLAEQMALLTLLSEENKQLQVKTHIMDLACKQQQNALEALYPEAAVEPPAVPVLASGVAAETILHPDEGLKLTKADVEWAQTVNLESYSTYWRGEVDGMQQLLDAVENPDPALPAGSEKQAMMTLELRLAQHMQRFSLLLYTNPTLIIKLRGYNLQDMVSAQVAPAPAKHWFSVLERLKLSAGDYADLVVLFQAYGTCHAMLSVALKKHQAAFDQLMQDLKSEGASQAVEQTKDWDLKQMELLKKIRSSLVKVQALYIATLTLCHALKPKIFAKTWVYSWPYSPCTKSLMDASAQYVKGQAESAPK